MSKSVWYRAAERIASGEESFACWAIPERHPLKSRRPDIQKFRECFVQDTFVWWPMNEGGRLARTIALLLMDELEKDGQI